MLNLATTAWTTGSVEQGLNLSVSKESLLKNAVSVFSMASFMAILNEGGKFEGSFRNTEWVLTRATGGVLGESGWGTGWWTRQARLLYSSTLGTTVEATTILLKGTSTISLVRS